MIAVRDEAENENRYSTVKTNSQTHNNNNEVIHALTKATQGYGHGSYYVYLSLISILHLRGLDARVMYVSNGYYSGH